MVYIYPKQSSWAHRADRTSGRSWSLGEKVLFYISGLCYVSWLAVLGKEVSSSPLILLLGTEASWMCPALLPPVWNVNKPAGKTKTQLRALPQPRDGQGRPPGPRGAHRACPSSLGMSCSLEWSLQNHTSHLSPSSCSCFSGGEKTWQKPSHHIESAPMHEQNPGHSMNVSLCSCILESQVPEGSPWPAFENVLLGD